MWQIEVQHGVGTLKLARPERRNAFDGEMLAQLRATLAAWQDDPAVRVVVLAAEGSTFCAGADLMWMAAEASKGHEGNLQNAIELGRSFHALARSRKPVVARVQGAARGGGVGLVAACDIAVASTQASFALTEVRLGLAPAVISPFVVERLGPSQARALFLTGDEVPAADAYRLGLVHHLVAPEDLDAKVAAVVRSLVAGGPEALVACKRLVDEVAFRPPEAVLEATAALIAERRASAEAQEGMVAFLQKRPAAWIPQP